LFDNSAQKTTWRKQLPKAGTESFHMRNIGKNILVHSDERAIMINSAGQILYEVPFEGTGKTVVEIF